VNKCRLCQQFDRLIKAHIIPEAFFRELRSGELPPILVTNKFGAFPKNMPIGVYDKYILCAKCEKKFDLVDAYGIEVLLKRFKEYFCSVEGNRLRVGFESNKVDKFQLLRFFIAVLWRASVSTQDFYRNVDLGPYEELAARSLTAPDVPPVFDAVVSCWTEDSSRVPMTALLDPSRDKWRGVNAYRIYFGRIMACVKVDRRPFPDEMRTASLQTNSKTLVVEREMMSSKEYQVMKFTVKRSEENAKIFRSVRNMIQS
jgi:hypothetical protein